MSTTPTNNSLVILPESAYSTQRRKRRQIPDIATWVQVYTIYMLVLATSVPDQLPELIAYQLLIAQHSRRFEYPSWLRYDMEFRQWAAMNNYLTWSQIHPQYYAFAFTAQGKTSAWCPICYTDGGTHTYDCPKFSLNNINARPSMFPSQQLLSLYIQPKSLPPRVPPPQHPTAPVPPIKRARPDYCILYKKFSGTCPYGEHCRFPHRCALCGRAGHPVASCPSKAK